MSLLSPEERWARLHLARTEGVGAVGFSRLLEEHGSASVAIKALVRAGKPVADKKLIEAEFERVAEINARHIFLGEADYPPLLAELSVPPPLLVATGDIGLARRPVVAIVGARNASAAGCGLAAEFARGLSEAGVVVISGLARGIDAAAHKASIEGGTIACVAGGLDVAYPPENENLQWQVAEVGLLVTEAPPRTQPMRRHFPRRNRLIAGMALGVVVVEGARGSGSLITASIAAEAGREVLAVPGHPKDPRSSGGNALIREGALLVETAADILEGLGLGEEPTLQLRPAKREVPSPRQMPPASVERPAVASGEPVSAEFLHHLSVSPIAVDDLVRLSGRSAAEIQAELTALEIEGRVERVSGGRVRLTA